MLTNVSQFAIIKHVQLKNKNMTKYKSNKKHHSFLGQRLLIHPLHFHFSMGVALAAVFVTAGKSSGHAFSVASHMAPAQAAYSISSMHVRDAETLHGHIITSQARRPYISGT